MKKNLYIILSFSLLIFFNSCSGYKPIFSASNIQFEIDDHLIEGDKKLGNQIYLQLYNLSKSNKKSPDSQSIFFSINTKKNKKSTVKDTTGKILEYKISINSHIKVSNSLTNDIIVDQNFSHFLSYKVQDQHSETIKLESQIIQNLLNKIYQDLLIKMSENILSK